MRILSLARPLVFSGFQLARSNPLGTACLISALGAFTAYACYKKFTEQKEKSPLAFKAIEQSSLKLDEKGKETLELALKSLGLEKAATDNQSFALAYTNVLQRLEKSKNDRVAKGQFEVLRKLINTQDKLIYLEKGSFKTPLTEALLKGQYAYAKKLLKDRGYFPEVSLKQLLPMRIDAFKKELLKQFLIKKDPELTSLLKEKALGSISDSIIFDYLDLGKEYFIDEWKGTAFPRLSLLVEALGEDILQSKDSSGKSFFSRALEFEEDGRLTSYILGRSLQILYSLNPKKKIAFKEGNKSCLHHVIDTLKWSFLYEQNEEALIKSSSKVQDLLVISDYLRYFGDEDPEMESENKSLSKYLLDKGFEGNDPIDAFFRKVDEKLQEVARSSKESNFLEGKTSLLDPKKVLINIKLKGIPNVGNTCFMNAAMQVLDSSSYDLLDPDKNPLDSFKIREAIFEMSPGKSRLSLNEYFSEKELKSPRGKVLLKLENQVKNNPFEMTEKDIGLLVNGFKDRFNEIQREVFAFLKEKRSCDEKGTFIDEKIASNLRQKIVDFNLVQAPVGNQECSGALLCKILHPFVSYTDLGKDYFSKETTSYFFKEEDFEGEKEAIDKAQIPEGESLYKEQDLDGKKVYAIYKSKKMVYVGSQRLSFMFKHEDEVVYDSLSTRYIEDKEGQVYRVQAKKVNSFYDIEIPDSCTTFAVEPQRIVGRKGESENFPAIFENNGHKFVLTSATFHSGLSSKCGHYTAARLVGDAEKRWSICDDSSVRVMPSEAFKSLSDVKTDVTVGYRNLKDLIQNHSNFLVYQRIPTE